MLERLPQEFYIIKEFQTDLCLKKMKEFEMESDVVTSQSFSYYLNSGNLVIHYPIIKYKKVEDN